MSVAEQAQAIGQWMAEHDRFARLLNIQLEAVEPGAVRASMLVDETMLNALDLTHGGATYTLADFAFAVASNSHGRAAVALTTTMSYPAASRAGDRLSAVATEEAISRQIATYRVEVRRGDGTLVGLFNGTVFRRDDLVADRMTPAQSQP